MLSCLQVTAEELLPVPGIRLQTVHEVAQRRVDAHPVAVVVPRGAKHPGIDIIGVGRGCRKGWGKHVSTVSRGCGGDLGHRLKALATRGRTVCNQLEGRAYVVGAQVFGLYPQGLAVIVFLVVGSQGVGLGEEAQVNAVAHRFISFGVEVEPVVLEEELPLHGDGVLRVAHGLVEVDDAVEHLRRAYPLVQRAAALLVVGGVVAVALERGDGCAEDVDAILVSFADNLLIDVDDAGGCLHTVTRSAQVVDGFEDNNPLHALLS